MSDQAFFMSKDFFSDRGDVSLNPGMLYASVGIGVALSTCVVFMLACCVIRRKKQKTDQTVVKVKEGYSVAVDSVSVHQYERYHYAEYSIPEDAITSTRAQHRVSVSDGEYDTLTRNFKRSLANTGHVYSHVTLPRTESKQRKSSSGSESHYDVTPYSKNKTASAIVTVSNDDRFGDIYGHVTINPMHNIQDV